MAHEAKQHARLGGDARRLTRIHNTQGQAACTHGWPLRPGGRHLRVTDEARQRRHLGIWDLKM